MSQWTSVNIHVPFTDDRNTTLQLSVRPGTERSLETALDMEPANDADGIDLFLDAALAERVNEFRKELRTCESDMERFQSRVRMRNRLLEEYASIETMFIAIERVMSSECDDYRRYK